MKATLTIIRGGPKEPSAMLAFEDNLSHDRFNEFKAQFDDWWNDRGGVFIVAGVALSVVDINLDITSSGVTLIPNP